MKSPEILKKKKKRTSWIGVIMMELIIIICVLTLCRHECTMLSRKLQRFLTGFLLEIGIGQ